MLVKASSLDAGSKQQNSSIYGTVNDAVTGKSLSGATLFIIPLEKPDGTKEGSPQIGTSAYETPENHKAGSRGAITSENGTYSLTDLPSGLYSVTASHVGYQPVTQTLHPENGKALFQKIGLMPKLVQSTPVIVTSHKPIRPSHQPASPYAETIEKWQGGKSSVSPMQQLNLFGGIQGGMSLSDVHIQGSPRGGHRVFLDEMPVYNPYALGTVMGAFSAISIGNISLSKAGFKASDGSYTAGKIDLSHDLGNRRQSTLSTHADFLHSHGVFHSSKNSGRSGGPGNSSNSAYPDGERFQMMVGYRSKLWDLHRGNGISSMINDWSVLDSFSYQILMGERIGANRFQQSQALSDASYSDLHTAASYRFDEYRTLYFSLYRGENSVMTDLLTRDEQPRTPSFMFTSDKYNWRNIVSRIRYDWIVSDRIDLTWQTGYSSNTFDHTYSMADNSEIQTLASGTEEDIFQQLRAATLDGNMRLDQNNIHHVLAKWDLQWYPASSLTLRSGLQIDHVQSDIEMEDLFYTPIIHHQKTNLVSHYAELNWFTTPSLHITTGYRLSGFLSNQLFYLEPRFSVQYDHQTRRNHMISIKLAGGKYHQFINQFEITNAGPNNIVPFITVWSHDANILQPEAYHLSLSTIYDIPAAAELRMDLFANLQPVNYITSYMMLTGEESSDQLADPIAEAGGGTGTGIESFSKHTDFRSLGGSIRVSRSFWKDRFDLMAGYDLEFTRVNMEGQFGGYLPAPWSQPHRLQIRGLFRVLPGLTLIGKWSGIWGRTWAFRDVYYNYLAMDEMVQRIQALDFRNPDKDTLAPFYRLDLSVSYQPTLLNGLLEVRADLMNVLNRRNVLDRTLSTEPDRSFIPVNRTLPGFTPSLSLGLRF